MEFTANSHWETKEFAWDAKCEEALQLIFGHNEFRPNQKKIINAVMAGVF